MYDAHFGFQSVIHRILDYRLQDHRGNRNLQAIIHHVDTCFDPRAETCFLDAQIGLDDSQFLPDRSGFLDGPESIPQDQGHIIQQRCGTVRIFDPGKGNYDIDCIEKKMRVDLTLQNPQFRRTQQIVDRQNFNFLLGQLFFQCGFVFYLGDEEAYAVDHGIHNAAGNAAVRFRRAMRVAPTLRRDGKCFLSS